MDFKIAFTGLTNVGKSVIFETVTGIKSEVTPYPSTNKPVIGSISLEDERLLRIANLIDPTKLFPVMIEVADAGSVILDSEQGTRNQGLSLEPLRDADVIIIVLRMFKNESVSSEFDDIDLIRDMNEISSKLARSDLELVLNWKKKVNKMVNFGRKELMGELKVLIETIDYLQRSTALNRRVWPKENYEIFDKLNLVTHKHFMVVVNIGEDDIAEKVEYDPDVLKISEEFNAVIVVTCGQLELEILEISPEEQSDFLLEYGNYHIQSQNIIKESLRVANRISYFTFGKLGLKQWIVEKGEKVLLAAKRLHTDISKGFVVSEVISIEELEEYGSFEDAKKKGSLRLEGKDYSINDGDILYFRFTV